MKFLVTGATGLVGGHFCRTLRRCGHQSVPLTRSAGVDITVEREAAACVEAHPDAAALLHLAAYTDVSAAWKQRNDRQGDCFRINVEGTRHLADACARRGLPLIFVSTDFVFDGGREGPYTEEDPPSPIEWYGETKWMAEQLVRERSPHWYIARISHPFGGGPSAPRLDLIARIAQNLLAGRTCTLFQDQIITPTFLDDICEGLLLLGRAAPADSGVFHLTGSTSLSPFALGQTIAARLGCSSSLVQPGCLRDFLATDPRPRQARLELSNARWNQFAASRGLAAPLTIEEALSRCLPVAVAT